MLETLVPLRLERVVAAAAAATASPAFTALAVTAALLLLVLRLYRQAYQKPENFPPGPPRLPIWGSYWLMLWEDYRFMHKSLLTLAERYKTKVLGFYLGDFPCVMLKDYEDIKEMQSRSDLIGRADVIVARERSLGQRYDCCLFRNTDGPQWSELRRFLLRHIRDFGWGRRFPATEEIMQQELADATALLRGEWDDEEVKRGDRVLISHLFPPYAMNAMWAMFGHARLPRGQHAPWHRIHRSVSNFFRATDPSGSAVSLTPWLRFLTPRRFGLQDVTDFNVPMRDFVK
ncbi:Probable cytochrome P450 304a1, partial [Gryllus bimaculatus]